MTNQAWLDDVLGSARRIAASMNTELPMRDESIYGGHCEHCDQRWALPADKASCPHKPICEDCWPNGCDACEREVEEGIRRREEATHRILSAALEIRTGCDDLSETDLAALDFVMRKDIARHVELSIEALRRVGDTLNAQRRGKA